MDYSLIEDAIDKLRLFLFNSKNLDSLNHLQTVVVSDCYGLLLGLLDSFDNGNL